MARGGNARILRMVLNNREHRVSQREEFSRKGREGRKAGKALAILASLARGGFLDRDLNHRGHRGTRSFKSVCIRPDLAESRDPWLIRPADRTGPISTTGMRQCQD